MCVDHGIILRVNEPIITRQTSPANYGGGYVLIRRQRTRRDVSLRCVIRAYRCELTSSSSSSGCQPSIRQPGLLHTRNVGQRRAAELNFTRQFVTSPPRIGHIDRGALVGGRWHDEYTRAFG